VNRHPWLVAQADARGSVLAAANASRKNVSSNPKCRPSALSRLPVKYHHSLLNSSWLA
jgi:hypothetical protein